MGGVGGQNNLCRAHFPPPLHPWFPNSSGEATAKSLAAWGSSTPFGNNATNNNNNSERENERSPGNNNGSSSSAAAAASSPPTQQPQSQMFSFPPTPPKDSSTPETITPSTAASVSQSSSTQATAVSSMNVDYQISAGASSSASDESEDVKPSLMASNNLSAARQYSNINPYSSHYPQTMASMQAAAVVDHFATGYGNFSHASSYLPSTKPGSVNAQAKSRVKSRSSSGESNITFLTIYQVYMTLIGLNLVEFLNIFICFEEPFQPCTILVLRRAAMAVH